MHPVFLARGAAADDPDNLCHARRHGARLRERLAPHERAFARGRRLRAEAGRHLLLPGAGGRARRGPVRARGRRRSAQGPVPARGACAACCRQAPIVSPMPRTIARLAALAFALGCYRFTRYRKQDEKTASWSCPAMSTAKTSPASSTGSGSHAISSTRRPTTWDRRSSRTPRARSRAAHGASVRVDRRRRSPRGEFSAHPCGRPRRRPPAAPDRHHLGRSRRSQGDADRQGRVLRHRRPRHQVRERHAAT